MKFLGYSTDRLPVKARDTSADWEVDGAGAGDATGAPIALQRACRLQVAMRDPPPSSGEAESIERCEMRTSLPARHPTTVDKVIVHLEKKTEVAVTMA
ncbi:hypothetical protein ON010_g16964 [Phytophthora cinnamomi]|nr:hypothetical protein ON010_g16964 [Phytophthora cinnamomi]